MPRRKPNRVSGKFNPEKQVRWDLEYAKRCITEDDAVMPLFVVHSKETAVPIAWGGDTDYDDTAKAAHRRMARLVCVAQNAFAVAYVGEAWIAFASPDDENPMQPRVMPRDREDRREIIMAQMMWRDEATGQRKSIVAQAEIVRGEKGKCTGVINEEYSDTTLELGGNFADILPEREATAEEQDVAKQMLDQMVPRPN